MKLRSLSMELDVKAFARNIMTIGEQKMPAFDSDGVKYLYDLMSRYVSDRDCDLRVRDIDFNMFSIDDCTDFDHLYDEVIAEPYRALDRFADIFKSAAPMAQAASRLFF